MQIITDPAADEDPKLMGRCPAVLPKGSAFSTRPWPLAGGFGSRVGHRLQCKEGRCKNHFTGCFKKCHLSGKHLLKKCCVREETPVCACILEKNCSGQRVKKWGTKTFHCIVNNSVSPTSPCALQHFSRQTAAGSWGRAWGGEQKGAGGGTTSPQVQSLEKKIKIKITRLSSCLAEKGRGQTWRWQTHPSSCWCCISVLGAVGSGWRGGKNGAMLSVEVENSAQLNSIPGRR